MKKLRSNMRVIVIGVLVTLILLFAVTVCIVGYSGIAKAFREEYSSVTHHMADEAAVVVNGDHIDQYLAGEETAEYADTKSRLDISCQKLHVSLIYVIKVDRSDYGRFVSVFNSVDNSVDDSDYTAWELGFERNTTNDEYREKYRALYEQQTDCETIFRLHTTDGQHPHITTLVPVKDSAGEVAAILCMQRPVREMSEAFGPYLLFIIVNVAVMAFLICFIASRFLKRSIIVPVEKVSKEAARFSKEYTRGESLGEISKYDEILALAHSIDTMETDILHYIDDMTAITAEKEKIAAELSIAAMIQSDSLPDVFPPYPERKEFEIYASMDPARKVGGDFYNFFFVDDDHLALLIADVSGKGIPGALFMMVSNLVIVGRTTAGDEPSDILRYANNYLCRNNRAEMFVTVWLGILEISTGHLIYANAGHEDPAVYRRDAGFELVKDKHGFVLGGMEGTGYRNQELQLNKGDKLFLYTDGVPEATDKYNCMFGTGRMLEALNSAPDADPEQLLKNVRRHVDRFVRDAEQFDDLTMLCLQYNGTEE